MELNLGQWIVMGLCAILIIGYIRGYFYNRKQAVRSASWLLEGLKPWGRVAAGEKLPGMVTGGRLVVEPASAPLRKIEALFLLAPRENPLFWIFYRLQGKRDELIVWVTYASKPEQVVEVARQGDRQFQKALQAEGKPALTLMEAPARLQMACAPQEGAVLAEKVAGFVQQYRTSIVRLSLRDNKPHLFLRADLRAVQAHSAIELFKALGNLTR